MKKSPHVKIGDSIWDILNFNLKDEPFALFVIYFLHWAQNRRPA